MFPDNLHICDPTDGRLYIVENDVVTKRMYVVKEARSILVCQNMADIYTVNRDTNTITRIHNGEPTGDIRVGGMPYGICEDINGRIYVTNYADHTVSVVQDGKVVGLPIPVSAGPRGIVADYYGNVWVACYLSNTVVKITNHTVVDEIAVPYNPEGITCSPTNDIWVACSGSNCAVKITHSVKQLTVATGKCPVAIVCDKRGNIFTANFEEDTVTMISSKDEYATATISVGDGPSAIAVNSSNLIYVTSNLSGEMVYKINPSTQQIIDRIHVCKSQCAFGDFTGCAAFNVFYPNGRDGLGTLIPSSAVNNVVQSLKPTFKAIMVDETEEGITVNVTSDLLDLDKFDNLTLNEIARSEEGTFFIPTESIGTELILRGSFEDSNGTSTVTFVPVTVKFFFKAYFGVVDHNYDNYMELKSKVVDFNTKDVVSTYLQQPVDGHLVVLVPHRVLDNFQISDGMMVQGNYNIGDNWQSKKSIEDSIPKDIDFEVDSTKPAYENVFTFADCYAFTVTSGDNTLVEGLDYTSFQDAIDEETAQWGIKLKEFTKIVDNKITVHTQPFEEEQSEIAIKLQKIYNALNDKGWSEARQNQYCVLVNNYQTNANEKWMFNFFDIAE